MANILDIGEYARFSFDELVDMIKNLENRIEELEDNCEAKDQYIDELIDAIRGGVGN